jgi:hypothetical protein
MARGQDQFTRARALVAKGDIAASVSLFQSGITDMNRAIAAAPQSFDLHLARGLAFGPFPGLYNLATTVRGDLEFVVSHARFEELASEQPRARGCCLARPT